MWSNLLVVRIHLLVNVARLLLVHTRHGHRVEELIKRQHVVAVLVDARKYALQSGHRFAPLHNEPSSSLRPVSTSYGSLILRECTPRANGSQIMDPKKKSAVTLHNGEFDLKLL